MFNLLLSNCYDFHLITFQIAFLNVSQNCDFHESRIFVSFSGFLNTVVSLIWRPRWLSGKESTCNTGDTGSIHVGKIRWRRKCQLIPVFLPGKPQGQGSLVGYSPWDSKTVRHDLEIERQWFHYLQQ